MPPRKKHHETDTDRQKAFQARQRDAGKRRLCLWIDGDVVDNLKSIAAGREQTQAEVVEALIRAEAEKK